jgi:hypothetical protein
MSCIRITKQDRMSIFMHNIFRKRETNIIFKKLKGNQNKMKLRGRKRKLFASTMLILRLLFGGLQSASASSNSKTFQSGVNSKTEISRTLNQESSMIANFNPEGLTQPELVPEDSQLLLTLGLPRGGEWQPNFGPGPQAKADARKAGGNQTENSKAGNSQSGGSPFAEAFTVEPKFLARPGRNGLFGRFSPRPTPDPFNPGCAGGPRSITVLSQSKSSEQDSAREITAHDGVKGRLTDKSTNHLTSKHGGVLGIDDPLPPNPNQKPTKYKQIRTRVNKENKEKFGDIIEEILKDPTTEPYSDVSMRGIKGHGYYTENYGESGFFVGIHTEGEFAGQITKAQPVSDNN